MNLDFIGAAPMRLAQLAHEKKLDNPTKSRKSFADTHCWAVFSFQDCILNQVKEYPNIDDTTDRFLQTGGVGVRNVDAE